MSAGNTLEWVAIVLVVMQWIAKAAFYVGFVCGFIVSFRYAPSDPASTHYLLLSAFCYLLGHAGDWKK